MTSQFIDAHPQSVDLEIRREFGRAAEACRNANGLSLGKIGRMAGLDPRTVARIENGANVRVAGIYRLAAILEHLDPSLFFDFVLGEAKLSAPEQSPAILVAEWRNDKVRRKQHRTRLEDIAASHPVRRAWLSLRQMCDDISQANTGSNWPRVNHVLKRFSEALGRDFVELDVISLGVHGERLLGLSRVRDAPLTDEAMEDLKALARVFGPFVYQFEDWREYKDAAYAAPDRGDVIVARNVALELANLPEIIAEDVSKQLVELASDVSEAPDDRIAEREIVFGLRNVLSALLLPISKGAGAGLESLAKLTVFASGSVLVGLAASYPSGFGWLTSWLDKMAALMK